MLVGKVVRKKLEMSLKFISFSAWYPLLCRHPLSGGRMEVQHGATSLPGLGDRHSLHQQAVHLQICEVVEARGLSECASTPQCGPSRERLADGRQNCRHECGLKGASGQATSTQASLLVDKNGGPALLMYAALQPRHCGALSTGSKHLARS